MHGERRVAVIDEAPGELLDEVKLVVHLAEQQATGVGSNRRRVKAGRDLAAAQGVKFQRFSRTLCHHQVAPMACENVLQQRQLRTKGRLGLFIL
jgi:uncharacterized protein with GYD domain